MDRITRIATYTVAALALLPALLGAQTPEQRIDRALDRAMQVGVPVELLQSKLALGRARGYPAELIAQGIERRLATLEQVKTAIGDRSQLNAEELGVAADAISAGVSQTVLATLAEGAPRERRAVAIAVLTELVQQGHASEVALSRVTQALQQGPEALRNLPAQSSGRGQGPPEGSRGQGAGAQNGRGGPPPSVPAGGGDPPGRGRGRGGPQPESGA